MSTENLSIFCFKIVYVWEKSDKKNQLFQIDQEKKKKQEHKQQKNSEIMLLKIDKIKKNSIIF